MAEAFEIKPTKNIDQPIGEETLRILQRVYRVLYNEGYEYNEKTFYKYTGMTNFKQYKRNTSITVSVRAIDRSYIQRILHKVFYIDKRVAPTTKQLLIACKEVLPCSMDIVTFRKLLFKLNYVWTQIKGKYVIFENPSTRFERYSFLRTILNHKDDVYFIEENSIDTEFNYYSVLETVKSNCESLVKVIYAVSKDKIVFKNSFIDNFNETNFRNWIANELVPVLEKPSIIVYNCVKHHREADPCENISINMLKCEMKRWLDLNKVPYDESMSKTELYTLIEKFTDKRKNTYVVDKIIAAHGHVPLRIPRDIENLHPGHYVYQLIKKNIRRKKRILAYQGRPDKKLYDTIHCVLKESLQEFFDYVYDEYQDLFDDEKEIDKIMGVLYPGAVFKKSELYLYTGDSDIPSVSEDSD